MLDTLKIYNELKEKLEPEAALKIAETMGYIYSELQNTVTKTDFNDLKEIVRDLSEAQKRTEQRLEKLTIRVDELAEAQKRTEVELSKLTQQVRKLATDQKDIRRQLGGLSATVGYTLEDRAFLSLPKLLERDFGITVEDDLKRDYIRDNEGREIEVNILGKGSQNGKELLIVGEGKSQLSKNDIDNFIRKKLKRLEGVHENLFPVLITYMISEPDAQAYAKNKGIALYYSYQFRPLVIY